jgi:(1->4)-alpha-D-glucan 1-alpha-D-glucosylmutase
VERLAEALGVAGAAPSAAAPVRERGDGAPGDGDPLFIERFGQVSGPAAAKGIEDAAFYVHVPLLSRNEVGSEPSVAPSGAVARLHAANTQRARDRPATMLAATTHDTKRSADARARLDVLSELAGDWSDAVERWRRWARARANAAGAVDANTEYTLYQTLVAIWPTAAAGRPRYAVPPARELEALAERLHAYMEKAVREAGRRTGWLAPDAEFESALHSYVDALLRVDPERDRFVRDLTAFVSRVARPGLWNALAKLVVQAASPGVCDVYQGDEMWTFTLVDPDNRRPVDFALRRRALAALDRAFDGPPAARRRLVRDLVADAEDGRLKLHVLHRALNARRRAPDLFVGGDYVALEARGPAARHVVAFARSRGGRWAVAAAVRLALTLTGDAFRDPLGPDVWDGTDVVLPAGAARAPLVSALTGERLGVRRSGGMAVVGAADLFAALPADLALST